MEVQEPGAILEAPSASQSGAGARRSPWLRYWKKFTRDIGNIRPRLRIANAILFFLPPMSFIWARGFVYRSIGLKIGPRTSVLGRLDLHGSGRIWERLRIGADCQLTAPIFLDLGEEITIGNNVAIGHHAVLVTTNHATDWPWRRCGHPNYAPIVIEDGAWIAARATILPGVRIGTGSIVAAGAVVAADVPAHSVVAGVPAKPIKRLPT